MSNEARDTYMRMSRQVGTISAQGHPVRDSYVTALGFQGKTLIQKFWQDHSLGDDPTGAGETIATLLYDLDKRARTAVCDYLALNTDDYISVEMLEENAIREVVRCYAEQTGDRLDNDLTISYIDRLDAYHNNLGGIIQDEHARDALPKDRKHSLYLKKTRTSSQWAVLQNLFEALGVRQAELRLQTASEQGHSLLSLAKVVQQQYDALPPQCWSISPPEQFSRFEDDHSTFRRQPVLQAAQNAIMALEHIGFTDPETERVYRIPLATNFKAANSAKPSIDYCESVILSQLADPSYQGDASLAERALGHVEQLDADQLRAMDIRVKAILCACLSTRIDQRTGKVEPQYRNAGKRIVQNTQVTEQARANVRQINGDFVRMLVEEPVFEDMVRHWRTFNDREIDSVLQIITDYFCECNGLNRVTVVSFYDPKETCYGYFKRHKGQPVIALNTASMFNFFDMHDTFSTLFHELGCHGVVDDFIRNFENSGVFSLFDEKTISRADEFFFLFNRIFYTSDEDGVSEYAGQMEEVLANDIGSMISDEIEHHYKMAVERIKAREGVFQDACGRMLERPHLTDKEALARLFPPHDDELTKRSMAMSNARHVKPR